MAKLPKTRPQRPASNLLVMSVRDRVCHLDFRGTISILVAPLGGVNLNTDAWKVGFRFQ